MKLKIFVPLIGLLILLGSLWQTAPTAQAQGTPLPPPTTIPPQPEKREKQKRDTGTTVNVQGAGISGVVFNYSTGAAQPGLVVEIEGENQSFRAETVTDAQGHYQFGGLGSGQATLNVHLPDGAVSVTPNWPVALKPATDQVINLGFYYRNQPLPVMVTGVLQQNRVELQINNRTRETVKGGQLEILLFSGVEAVPSIQVTQGDIQYGVSRVLINLGDLVSGGQATIQVPVKNFPAVSQADLASQTQSKVRVIFTYPNQPTIQLLNLIPQELVAAMAKVRPTAKLEVAEPFPAPSCADATLCNAPVATAVPTLAVAPVVKPPTPASEIKAAKPLAEAASVVKPLSFSFDPKPTLPSLMPETGYHLNNKTTGLIIVALLIGGGLLVMGGWSLRK